MTESEKKQPDLFSKSQLKRDMINLQQMGKELVDLPESQLAKIDLPEKLLDAIHLAHTLKTHEAKRRHLQYIGKIMREVDPAPIQAGLAKIKLARG